MILLAEQDLHHQSGPEIFMPMLRRECNKKWSCQYHRPSAYCEDKTISHTDIPDCHHVFMKMTDQSSIDLEE